MTAKDVLAALLKSNRWVTLTYLSDLSDADLLVRPVPGANHIAWQFGHCVAEEAKSFQPRMPGAQPATLPAGFAEQHSKATADHEVLYLLLTKAE